MFNAEKPTLEELPSSAQLLRSTILAAVSAVVILVMVVVPAEYGIDPTGMGRVLGLTEMGQIKQQLEEEAEQDRQQLPDETSDPASTSGLSLEFLSRLAGLFVSEAYAQTAEGWKDETSFTLQPGDTYEFKLTMNDGDVVEYRMMVDGGRVNFDLHAHGGGQSITYEKGRGSTGSEGQLVAAFNGDHGWFWRNRDKNSINVTLQVRGTYSTVREGN